MGKFLSFNYRKRNCQGKIEAVDGGIIVDCRKCPGEKDIEDEFCFRQLAGRVHPGFNGKLILRSKRDTLVEGPAIEAMTTFSDIQSMFDELINAARRGSSGSSLKKGLQKARSDHEKDPLYFLSRKNTYLPSGCDEEIHHSFAEIVEKTSLMTRKLKRN